MLVAVDGGATQCRLAVFAADGQRLAECCLQQSASLTLGVEQAVTTIEQGIRDLESLVSRSLAETDLVCGLAGSLRTARKSLFVSHFNHKRRVGVITDGQAQLLGATDGKPGACLAMGTGSVIHWQDSNGRFGMAGGWGYPVGDEGSAAWLGMQLLQAYTHACDSGELSNDLWLELQDRIGASIEEIQDWTTCVVSSRVGSLATLVSTHALDGNSVARRLLANGVDACQRLLAYAPSDIPHCLMGGLADVYRQELEQRGHVLEHPVGDALDGLRWYALRQVER